MTGAFVLLLSVVIGWLLALAFWPARPHCRAEHSCVFFAGLALGPGALSTLYYFWGYVLHLDYAHLPFAEGGLAIALALVVPALQRRRPRSALTPPANPVHRPYLAWAFWAVLAMCLLTLALLSLNRPHGEWDSWVIWNQRARMLVLGKDCFFRSMRFANHGDYPLLIPGFIAHCWTYMDSMSALIPVITGYIFCAAAAGLTMSALWLTRGSNQAYIGGLFLFGAYFFVRMCARQYADEPLAHYILACLVFLGLRDLIWPEKRGPLLLAGLFAGLAAWTKNEGMLFMLSLLAGLALVWLLRRNKRAALDALLVLAAALPVLAVMKIYKMQVSIPSDLFIGGKLKDNLLTFGRYVQVFKAFVYEWLRFANWSLLPYVMFLWPLATRLALPPGRRDGVYAGAASLCCLYAGYFVVYVITPHDLTIHLATSLERLCMHIWPGVVFLLLLAFVESPRGSETGTTSG